MSNNLLTIAAQLLDSVDRQRILMAGATAWGKCVTSAPVCRPQRKWLLWCNDL